MTKPIFRTVLYGMIAACAACAGSGSSAQPAGDTVRIYKSDGARQCEGDGTPPEIMRQELHGLRVHAAEKSVLPGMMFPAVCGGMTGRINVYTIDTRDTGAALKRGFKILPPEQEL